MSFFKAYLNGEDLKSFAIRYNVFFCLIAFIPHGISQKYFIHPGALNSKSELNQVKAKLKAGAQPWTHAFDQMKQLAIGGTHTTAPAGEKDQKEDGIKAYANALAWYYTRDAKYANQAIEILNLWGNTFPGYLPVDGQNLLVAGWIGALLGPAAEIMREYPGWKRADQARLQAMFKRAFYPPLNKMSTWNGNVDLTQIDAMINIAVFNDDSAEFNLAVSRFNKRIPSYFYQATDAQVPAIEGDGSNVNKFWNNPTRWVDGLTQETCRDNNHHAQYALASAIHIAEVAWHQGIDLYTINAKRLTDAMELMALQLTTGDMQGTCFNNVPTADIYDTWEIGYNHYHIRKGLHLPNTAKVLQDLVRVKGKSEWNIFFETLTHADLHK